MTTHLYQWAAVLFVFGFFMPSVNNWAHGGGFAGGWVTAEAMRFGDEHRESPTVQIVALLLLVSTVAGFVLSFIKVTGILLSH